MTFDTTCFCLPLLPMWVSRVSLSLLPTLWLRRLARFRVLAPRDVSVGCVLAEPALAVGTLNVIGVDSDRRRGKVGQIAPLALDFGNFLSILDGLHEVLVFGSPVRRLLQLTD